MLISTDYSRDLQSAIDGAPAGAVITLEPRDYLLTSGLLLLNKSRLTIRGAGRGVTRLIVTDQLLTQNGFPSTLNATCGVLTLYGCTTIVLEGFDIVGPESWHFVGGLGSTGNAIRNPAVNQLNYKGIAIRDRNRDITVRHVGIRNILDEALYFDAVVGTYPERAIDLTFESLDIRDSGHDGIAVNNSYTENVKIRGCTIENVGGNCVEGGCNGLIITDNYFAQPNPSNDYLVAVYPFQSRTIISNNQFARSDLTLGGGGAIQIAEDAIFGTRYQSSVIVSNNHISAIKTNTTDATNPGAAIDIKDVLGPVSITGNIVTACGRVNGSDPPAAAIHIRGAQTHPVLVANNILTRAQNTLNPGNNAPYNDVPEGVGNQEVGIRIAADVPVGNKIVIGDNLILADTEHDFLVAPLRGA